jgi:hypothetical protein
VQVVEDENDSFGKIKWHYFFGEECWSKPWLQFADLVYANEGSLEVVFKEESSRICRVRRR